MSVPEQLLDAALQNRLITKKQHAQVLEELAAAPGTDAGKLLVARRFLTPAQLERLLASMAPETIVEQSSLAPPPAASASPVPTTPSAEGGAARQTRVPSGVQPTPLMSEPTQAEVAAMAETAPADPVRTGATSHPGQASAPPPSTTPSAASPQPVAAPTPPPPPRKPGATSDASTPGKLKDLLKLARHWGASDLHISVGRPPFIRYRGEIRYLDMEPVDELKAEKLNFQLMSEEQRQVALKKLNLDFALELPGLGRHRCNVFHQRLGWDGVYRIVGQKNPTFDELGLPPVCKTLTEYHQGMVLVTGPARSGKTSTVAAMLDLVNRSRNDHIITVEDPVEFVHTPLSCRVTQREVGPHTTAFAAALRAALREDPDIIFVGEMRDLETTSIAISAAETGHLVFSTLHTGNASRTIARILDVYPVNQQDQIAVMISESMRGIVSQQLVPKKDGSGLALALEILVVNASASTLIKDGKTYQMASVMQSGKKIGMCTMDDSLLDLVNKGVISGAEAYRRAENKAMLESVKDKQ